MIWSLRGSQQSPKSGTWGSCCSHLQGGKSHSSKRLKVNIVVASDYPGFFFFFDLGGKQDCSLLLTKIFQFEIHPYCKALFRSPDCQGWVTGMASIGWNMLPASSWSSFSFSQIIWDPPPVLLVSLVRVGGGHGVF